MILIRRTGATEDASGWFARLPVGAEVVLLVDRGAAVRVFRRHALGPRPLLIEEGADVHAIRRALDAVAPTRSAK